jgi:hypothetical protein
MSLTINHRLAWALAILLSLFLWATTAKPSETHAPGTTHIITQSWADTLGNWYKADMDSVAIWVYAPPGSLWQHGAMTMVRPGEWIFSTDADSSGVLGDYWATIIGYDIQGRTPPAKDLWQVSEHVEPHGARTITVTCVDTSLTPDAVVAGAVVTARALATDNVVISATTNSTGTVEISYPAGIDTLRLQAEKLGTVIFGADTLSLPAGDAAVTDSLLGYTFAPDDPVDPTRCIAYGTITEGGTAVEGITVTRQIVLPSSAYDYVVVTSTGDFEPWGPVDTTTDSAGYFQFELYRNSDLSPANTTYLLVIEYYDHEGYERAIRMGFTIAAGTSCPVVLGTINL